MTRELDPPRFIGDNPFASHVNGGLHMRLALLTVIVLAGTASAADRKIELNSAETPVLGLPLLESDKAVYRISITAKVNEKGEGDGVLLLDATVPVYDEFGFPAPSTPVPPLKLNCTLKFEKDVVIKVVPSRRSGTPELKEELQEVKWKLYSVTGLKIKSRLFVSMTDNWRTSRLVVQDDKGKVKYSLDLHEPPEPLLQPCHPGCFPAGTPILLPDGTKTTVEKVRAGDMVATIGKDGVAAKGPVESVFITTNRLIAVKTETGALVTTETQPLLLASGELQEAGQLKAGNKIWRWDGKARHVDVVKSVTATGRQEKVYNLILKDKALFVADGFLARSKPPALPGVQSDAARPR